MLNDIARARPQHSFFNESYRFRFALYIIKPTLEKPRLRTAPFNESYRLDLTPCIIEPTSERDGTSQKKYLKGVIAM